MTCHLEGMEGRERGGHWFDVLDRIDPGEEDVTGALSGWVLEGRMVR